MKKIIAILILFLLSTGCNKYVTRNIYEHNYIDRTEAIADVQRELQNYQAPAIPLNQWMINTMAHDTILIEQKSMCILVDKKTSYTFIFTEFTYPSTVYYKFLVRYKGKNTIDYGIK